MGKQHYLVQFISTLSANEKRYFKLFTSIQPGEKRYLHLFDALETKGNYNAKALTNELGISASQLSDDKYYLYQSLLKSLRSFDSTEKQDIMLKEFVDIKLLIERKMYEWALDLIEKALRETRHLENFSFVQVLLEFKRRCLHTLHRHEAWEDINEEVRKNIEIQKEWNELNAICLTLEKLAVSGHPVLLVKSYRKNYLLQQKPERLLSIKAATCWFYAHWLIYRLLGDMPGQLVCMRERIKFFSANKQMQDIDIGVYLKSLLALASAEADGGNYANSLKAVTEMEGLLKKPHPGLPAADFEELDFFTRLIKAYLLRRTRAYAEAVAIASKLDQHKYLQSPDLRYGYTFDIAVALLHLRRTKEAYSKIEVLMQTNDVLRTDLQPYTRMLLILCQIDMGNFETVPHLIRTTKAWFKRKKITSPAADSFFSHIYAISKAAKADMPGKYAKFREALNKELDQFKTAEENLDLMGWLQYKTSGKNR